MRLDARHLVLPLAQGNRIDGEGKRPALENPSNQSLLVEGSRQDFREVARPALEMGGVRPVAPPLRAVAGGTVLLIERRAVRLRRFRPDFRRKSHREEQREKEESGEGERSTHGENL